jgi:hypothetical protein
MSKISPSILRMNIREIYNSLQTKLRIEVFRLSIITAIFVFLTPITIRFVQAAGQATPFTFTSVHDPGARSAGVGAGQPLANLSQTPGATEFFTNGQVRFEEVEVVQGGINNGLGPRFNTNQCSSCHAQPSVGGTSPSTSVYPFIGPNPETLVYNLDGAANTLPSFVTPDGPVVEARFINLVNPNGTVSLTPDGGVHDLFTIQGRSDASGCKLAQPNFAQNLNLGECDLPYSHSRLWCWFDRKHFGANHPEQHAGERFAKTGTGNFGSCQSLG